MIMNKPQNGNGNSKGAQTCATPGCNNTANPETGLCFPCECKLNTCKTPGCAHIANPASGYCPACEAQWMGFGRETANWAALADAMHPNWHMEKRWARR